MEAYKLDGYIKARTIQVQKNHPPNWLRNLLPGYKLQNCTINLWRKTRYCVGTNEYWWSKLGKIMKPGRHASCNYTPRKGLGKNNSIPLVKIITKVWQKRNIGSYKQCC